MNFPSFLNPWYAAAAAALTIPPLILLYFLKLRRRELPVSSTILWKKAIQDLQVNAPFQKLRKNLLLILQLLLLALLLLALSRPVISYAKGAGRSTVILIDRSASMATKDGLDGSATRLEEAKKRAKSLVDTLDSTSQAMVIAFDDSAETVQTFTADHLALKRAIDAVQQTDRKTKLKLAYQLAEAQTNFDPNQLRSIAVRPDVRVYSDGRVTDAADLSLHGDVTYEKIGDPKTGNIAIVNLSARRNYDRPTEVQVFARFADFGPDPTPADVQLSVDGQVKSVASVFLLPERWSEKERTDFEQHGKPQKDGVEFTLDLADAAVLKVEHVTKKNDLLPADDSAQVVVPAPKDLSVAVVTDGHNPFLTNLLHILVPRNLTEMTPQEWEAKKPTAYDIAIFDTVPPTFIPDAGNFVCFGVVPPNIKVTTRMKDGKPVVDPELTNFLDWQRDHPILKDLALQKIYFQDALKLQLPPEAEDLADAPDGPAMVLYRPSARQIFFITSFDPLYSSLPTSVTKSWPVFGYQLLQFLAVASDLDIHQSLDPGATPRIPRGTLDRTFPGTKSITLNGPAGSRSVPVPEKGDVALPPLDRVGLYTLDPPVQPYDRIAVNLLDNNESNTLPADKAPGGIGETQSGGPIKSRLELWWWLTACAALPLLLIEWWVYTRRVHL